MNTKKLVALVAKAKTSFLFPYSEDTDLPTLWHTDKNKVNVPITLFLRTKHSDTERCQDSLFCETPYGTFELKRNIGFWCYSTFIHMIRSIEACCLYGGRSYWLQTAFEYAMEDIQTVLEEHVSDQYNKNVEENKKLAERAKKLSEVDSKVKEYKDMLLKHMGLA